MMCPVCSASTSVKDSRPTEDGTIKRRRVCEGGHKFITWESTVDPAVTLRRRRAKAANQKRYLQANPEISRANMRRYRLRKSAKAEAKATGTPVEKLYERWGVL